MNPHKSIFALHAINTLIYRQPVEFESDEYCSAVASNVDEAKRLIEAGFEYVCSHNEIMLFKKRK